MKYIYNTLQAGRLPGRSLSEEMDTPKIPFLFMTSLHRSYYLRTILLAKTKVITRLLFLLPLSTDRRFLENCSMSELICLEKVLFFLQSLPLEYRDALFAHPPNIIKDYLHHDAFLTAVHERDINTIHTLLHVRNVGHTSKKECKGWKKIFRHKHVFVIAPDSFLRDKYLRRKLKKIPKSLGASIAVCISDKKIHIIQKLFTEQSFQEDIFLSLPNISLPAQTLIKKTNTPVFILNSLKVTPCYKQLIGKPSTLFS